MKTYTELRALEQQYNHQAFQAAQEEGDSWAPKPARLYRVTNEYRHEAWRAGMLELYGLRPWNRGQLCVFRVAGKRHRDGRHTWFIGGDENDCLPKLVVDGRNRLWDHMRMWHDQNNQLVITTEPYYEPEDVSDEINEICERFGLLCKIGEESPYLGNKLGANPAGPTLFMFRKRNA